MRSEDARGCPDEGAVLAFLEGRLASEGLDLMDRHLDVCSECRLVALVSTDGCGSTAGIQDATEAASPEAASVPSTRTWAPRTIVSGRYQISRFIGRGGMGEVYAAIDQSLGTQIAIKTLPAMLTSDRRAIARLKREAVLARRVTHPSVCRTFDFGSDGDTLFLTMELLEGETLGNRLRREGPLPLPSALGITEQLASALDAAHTVGVIHRDLKADNVMLLPGPTSAHPRVVVTDFGLAKLNVPGERLVGATEPLSGRFMGTLSHMAPEQIEGVPVTPLADIYALGVVVYQMVTGRLPFVGPTPLAAAYKRLREPAPAPGSIVPGLPQHWDDAIGRCLERDPCHRFASALALVEALKGGDRPAAPLVLRRRVVPMLALAGLLAPVMTNGASRDLGVQTARLSTPAADFADLPLHSSPVSAAAVWSPPADLAADRSRSSPPQRKRRTSAVKALSLTAIGGMMSEGPHSPHRAPVEQASSMATERSPARPDELLDPRHDDELIDPYGTSP